MADDQSGNAYNIFVWTIADITSGVVAASLPVLSSLFVRIGKSLKGSEQRTPSNHVSRRHVSRRMRYFQRKSDTLQLDDSWELSGVTTESSKTRPETEEIGVAHSTERGAREPSLP